MNHSSASQRVKRTPQTSRLAAAAANHAGGFFLTVTTALNEALVIADAYRPGQPIMFANAAFTRLTGYTEGEAFGSKLLFLHATDRNEAALKEIDAALAAGRECRVTLESQRKNGTCFWNEVSLTPIRDAQQTVTHFVAVHRDVSAHHDETPFHTNVA